MKKKIFITTAVTAAFLCTSIISGCASDDPSSGSSGAAVSADSAESAPVEAARYGSVDTNSSPEIELADLQGTYTELFPVFEESKYDSFWLDEIKEAAAVDDDTVAEQLKNYLIDTCSGEVYGDEAIAAVADDPSAAVFNCSFISGIDRIAIEGDTITGLDENGDEVFSHTYKYYGSVKMDFGEEMNAAYEQTFSEDEWPSMSIFKADESGDNFTYFSFAGDTPDSTYHIEFRYGSDLEALGQFYSGEYAYWLAAGINENPSDELVENCISLYVTENADSLITVLETMS